MSQPAKEHVTALKRFFGHSSFRPKQWEIIRAILQDRRDVCAVMATGYGKSLCYQFPPVFCEGLCLVISPLISLMKDQVLSLQLCNIPACLLGSAQKKTRDILDGVLNNEYRLLYVTPEWCAGETGSSFLEELKNKVNITMVAIDEAHCISQWGFDFRSSYRKLGHLRHTLSNVPFLTVTATATPQVREDICNSLKLKNPLKFCTSFDRPNLYFNASTKGKDILSDIVPLIRKDYLKNKGCGSVIIYCPTKKIADDVYKLLKEEKLSCALYHADLSMSLRNEVHEQFVKDEISVVVATIAFGMGIDKPDVRMIIHYGAPKDLETYYQEVGRAGRDGLPSYCHVFYSSADFKRNQYFLQNLSGPILEYKNKLTRNLERFLQTTECRRSILLSHFDPKFVSESNANCCDNCSRGTKTVSTYDMTEDAVLYLKATTAFGGWYGLGKVSLLLMGTQSKQLPEKFFKHELHGAGDEQSKEYWDSVGNLLLREGLLKRVAVNKGWRAHKSFSDGTISITDEGRQFITLEGKVSNSLQPTLEMFKLKKHKRIQQTDGWINTSNSNISFHKSFSNESPGSISLVDKKLENKIFEGLMRMRSNLAKELNVMPYMIASLRTLQDLSKSTPHSLEELSKVEGLTEAKIDRFGNDLLRCIRRFEGKGDINEDQDKQIAASVTHEISVPELVDIDDWYSTEKGPEDNNENKDKVSEDSLHLKNEIAGVDLNIQLNDIDWDEDVFGNSDAPLATDIADIESKITTQNVTSHVVYENKKHKRTISYGDSEDDDDDSLPVQKKNDITATPFKQEKNALSNDTALIANFIKKNESKKKKICL